MIQAPGGKNGEKSFIATFDKPRLCSNKAVLICTCKKFVKYPTAMANLLRKVLLDK